MHEGHEEESGGSIDAAVGAKTLIAAWLRDTQRPERMGEGREHAQRDARDEERSSVAHGKGQGQGIKKTVSKRPWR